HSSSRTIGVRVGLWPGNFCERTAPQGCLPPAAQCDYWGPEWWHRVCTYDGKSRFNSKEVATMWTKDALQELIQAKLRDRQFVLVANREPFLHRYVGGKVECVPPASGMVSALDPILRACGGVWIAHGSGNADRRT